MNRYYIYIYLDPRKHGKYCYKNMCFTFEPFYVGKGSNGRYKNISRRSDYFIRKINKIKKSGLEPIVIKLFENLFEKQSLDKEIELIEEIRKINPGFLVNETDGGDGTSGYIHTEESKNKMSENHKGKIVSEETRKKMSENNKGENHPNFGKHPSEETRKKMSESQNGKKLSEETRMKMSENHYNKIPDQKIIDIQSDIEKGDFTQTEISKKHGVCRMTIWKIKTEKIIVVNK